MSDNKKHESNKGEDVMATLTRNFVYEIKASKKAEKKEPIISNELLEDCKRITSKYPRKK